MTALFDKRPMDISKNIVNDEFGGHGVGVEVEVEGWTGNQDIGDKWHLTNDGSLRNNGIENVMRGPIYGKHLTEAFQQLDHWFNIPANKKNFQVNDRCSIHVHVDMRDMSPEAMRRLLTLYMIFEKSIYKYCGEGRDSSNYCPPIAECQEALKIVGEFMRKKRSKEHLEHNIAHFGKYAGVNFGALRTFGSLEFRMHEGTLDAGQIANWTKMLINLKDFSAKARKYKAEELPALASQIGFEELCAMVFGDTYENVYLQNNFRQDCYDGVRVLEYCQNLDVFEQVTEKIIYGDDAEGKKRAKKSRETGEVEGMQWAEIADRYGAQPQIVINDNVDIPAPVRDPAMEAALARIRARNEENRLARAQERAQGLVVEVMGQQPRFDIPDGWAEEPVNAALLGETPLERSARLLDEARERNRAARDAAINDRNNRNNRG